MLAACCRRLDPIRFMPLSYFCTCWKVSLKGFGKARLAHAELGQPPFARVPDGNQEKRA